MISQFYKQCEGNQEIKNWIDTVVSKQDNINITEVEHIIDYLKSDNAPTKLRKASYEQMKIATEKWTASLIKKAGDIVETEEDTKVVMKFNTGMILVKLIGEAAFKREGNLMSHCVGSYYGKNKDVYSLRDSNNAPHCTIEVDKDNVNQIKGKGNGSIHPKYIKYVLKILDKYFKLPIKDHELQNLGYIKLSEYSYELLDKHMNNVKYIMFNNVKYFYKYSPLKPKVKEGK